ncbi:hypothetical protein KKC32_04860 [Patescibacteria group bacterium]|nr:hypothetical protein [Patescibacteria group bacterium]
MLYLFLIGVLTTGLILVMVWPGRNSVKQLKEPGKTKMEEIADDDDYDSWLLKPGEEYVRIHMARTHMVLASTLSSDDLLSGNFQTGQWINFIVGYHPVGSPSFEIGGMVQKSRMIRIDGETVRETMLTDEKNGRRLLLLLGVVINRQAANLMVTGVQNRALS